MDVNFKHCCGLIPDGRSIEEACPVAGMLVRCPMGQRTTRPELSGNSCEMGCEHWLGAITSLDKSCPLNLALFSSSLVALGVFFVAKLSNEVCMMVLFK